MEFVCAMEDVLEIYPQPYDPHCPWVCFDAGSRPQTPEADQVVLVMDNLNTHKFASLYAAFPPAEARRIREKLEIHYTPKHGSGLNMAEIELSVLHRPCLKARIPDRATLMDKVAAWEQAHNASSVMVNWRFTTTDARIKLHKLYPSIDVC